MHSLCGTSLNVSKDKGIRNRVSSSSLNVTVYCIITKVCLAFKNKLIFYKIILILKF